MLAELDIRSIGVFFAVGLGLSLSEAVLADFVIELVGVFPHRP